MGTWWRRHSAVLGLLAAIFGDLRRRAWWAYRRGSSEGYRPTVGVTARRAEYTAYVPTLSASWHAVAAHALPVLEAEVLMTAQGEPRPTVMIDPADRPDVADAPRVLRQERTATDGHAVVGTQWLADLDHNRVLLVVTFVEPIASTWALSFDLPRTVAVLRQIAASSDLSIVWTRADADSPSVTFPDPSEGIHLTITRPAQLHAILGAWADREGARSRA